MLTYDFEAVALAYDALGNIESRTTVKVEVIPLTDPELYDGGPYQPQDMES